MNEFDTEPTPLLIINFQKYLQKCAINIPTNGEALGLIGTVLTNADYESVNNNQTWVKPTDPGTAAVLQMASDEGKTTRSSSDKSTKHTNRPLKHQQDVRQHEKKKTKYEKYQAGLTLLRNLITSNIEESYV